MQTYKQPNVFTVDPSEPFLNTVAAALCDGRLVEGFAFDGNPLELARATIFVPTRRAARELRSAFIDHLGQRSILLPTIKPLGEFDEDQVLFNNAGNNFLKTPPPVSSLERQLILGQLIAQWTKHLGSHLAHYFDDEEITTPVSTGDAFWLANDLASLLDQLQTEGIDFRAVDAAGEAEASDWWSITLAFLKIIRDEWPKILLEKNRIDPAEYRNRMLETEAAHLHKTDQDAPVIVAGSTGTIPATAKLIKVVSGLKMGVVVLPGYDLNMRVDTCAILEDSDEVTSAVGHHQFGLHNLVQGMQARGLVKSLSTFASPKLVARQAWISSALEPAPITDAWFETAKSFGASTFDDVAILVAETEREEAAAIAVALREAITDTEITCALVTPDRTLARRVVAELSKFGIDADDSGGRSFQATSHGQLISELLSLVFKEGSPAQLLSILKNPLVKIGAEASDHWEDLRLFENAILRGSIGQFVISDLVGFTKTQLLKREDHDAHHIPRALRQLDEPQCDRLLEFARRLQTILRPLVDIAKHEGNVSLRQCLRESIAAVESISADGNGRFDQLYDGEAGKTLRGLLREFLQADSNLTFNADQWPEILNATMSGLLVTNNGGEHPRLAVLGALEARLQTFDFLVVGGLIEGTWPSQSSNDAFLTRGMKARMNMQPPERRVGLAAHDLYMALGQDRVLLTYAERKDNAPTVPSRWLQRLETLAGPKAQKVMRMRGYRYASIARSLDRPIVQNFSERPNFTPPLSARPRHFSVTDIERLRRDPYALYAKKVLDLRPLDPLVRKPDYATRGTLIHAILENMVTEKVDFASVDAAKHFTAIIDAALDKENLPADIEILWRSRLLASVPNIIRWERERDQFGVDRRVEVQALSTPVGQTGVSLAGRADRLDIYPDGVVDIIDFKTGAAPSAKRVMAMLAPQMPLEAALLKNGSFDGIPKTDAKALLYVKLDARGEIKQMDVSKGTGARSDMTATDLADVAWEKLTSLLTYFADEQYGYISRAIPKSQYDLSDEYDHLARVQEWSSAGDDGSVEE